MFSFMACEKDDVSEAANNDIAFITAEGLEKFDCVAQQVDSLPSIEDARSMIVGTWQLKGMITMLPTVEVPNIKIEFKEDGGVFVTNAGENVFTNAYSINDNVSENGYRSIVITTDEFGIETNEYNFLTGTIRICQDELMIDNGIAFDAPGYLLRRT
ncbi:hypothetical protein DJ013_16175 [Arcticibacterium luteifluviistationis]|uniref:Lipocalin-like domain-containing protein n=2 Tax=Arcticibacterium luteifluviistationis TaxID=1784714 RepID=A0A2Z4GF08_9BACT|nr:hypothetical protein DJ013_16175 [Arcticibacterium luteifluviistationis]